MSLLSGLLWLMADMSGAIYSLRIFLIITIASAITWVLALKAVEIYLNFVDDEGNDLMRLVEKIITGLV